jgi:hypothetical protein
MSYLDLESDIQFEYGILPDERSSFRKFVKLFVLAHNSSVVGKEMDYFADEVVVYGWADRILKYNDYYQYVRKEGELGRRLLVRFPKLAVKVRSGVYFVHGTIEGFSEGLLCLEGTIEWKLLNSEDGFKLYDYRLYPRLRIKTN